MESFWQGENLKLSSGKVLEQFQMHYWINAPYKPGQKVVLFLHALTGDARVDQWWSALAGKDGLFNQEDYHLICINHLGSCYGSTGPLSKESSTGKPFYHRFPELSIKDLAEAQYLALKDQAFPQIDLAIGASLGGQVALELAFKLGARLKSVCLVASNVQHSAWGIALNESQRQAIELDPSWQKAHPAAGLEGLALARQIALLSYRSYQAYEERQGRDRTNSGEFKAASYQRYQGLKIQKRFNAFSYWHLSKAMDSHAIAESAKDTLPKLAQLEIPALIIGVENDLLFPFCEQEFLAENLKDSKLYAIDSRYGHDAFLIEENQVAEILNQELSFLQLKKELQKHEDSIDWPGNSRSSIL